MKINVIQKLFLGFTIFVIAVPTVSAITQLYSPESFSGASVIIDFDDGYDRQVVNTLYLNKGIIFTRDDNYDIYIQDWSAISWKTTLTLPNALATIRLSSATTWATHLNAYFPVPVNQFGAYFGNDEGFDVMTLSAYGANETFLGSVTVNANKNGDVDQFIGLSSNDPISSIRFENDGMSYAVVVDNLMFNPIPEPSTLTILALGTMLAGKRR